MFLRFLKWVYFCIGPQSELCVHIMRRAYLSNSRWLREARHSCYRHSSWGDYTLLCSYLILLRTVFVASLITFLMRLIIDYWLLILIYWSGNGCVRCRCSRPTDRLYWSRGRHRRSRPHEHCTLRATCDIAIHCITYHKRIPLTLK